MYIILRGRFDDDDTTFLSTGNDAVQRSRFALVVVVHEHRLDVVQSELAGLRHAEEDERYADETRRDVQPQHAGVPDQRVRVEKHVRDREQRAQSDGVDHDRKPYLRVTNA